ncbi:MULTISPECIES: lipocalin family protein [Arenibacter]|uniref:lipocalin family protein n=1 Tax=Arenibacter TaxID=178469 RepID=UPI0015935FB9|nr:MULTISPECIES: lipocalin family protein [Arenibacter]
MKNIILLFTIIISFSSCSQNDENQKNENSIYGTWKLVEIYGSDGGNSPQWNPVNNGYTYTFNSDNSFASNRFSECSTGMYELTSSNLTLKYNCDGFNTGIENPPGSFVENYVFESNHLILTPTYLNCDEGCSYKFEKVE